MAEFMRAYYQRLAAGEGRITALRTATLHLKRKNPNLYYWAPFVGIGRDEPLHISSSREAAAVNARYSFIFSTSAASAFGVRWA